MALTGYTRCRAAALPWIVYQISLLMTKRAHRMLVYDISSLLRWSTSWSSSSREHPIGVHRRAAAFVQGLLQRA